MVKYFRQFTQIFCKKQIVLVLRWMCERNIYLCNIYFYGEFVNFGIINSLDDLIQSHSLSGFEFRQFEGCVIFYRLKFDNVSQFPTILKSVRIDEELHVQSQHNDIPLALPS